jgi:hypothetical protein
LPNGVTNSPPLKVEYVKPFSAIGTVIPAPRGAVSNVIVFARAADARALATTTVTGMAQQQRARPVSAKQQIEGERLTVLSISRVYIR